LIFASPENLFYYKKGAVDFKKLEIYTFVEDDLSPINIVKISLLTQ